MPYSMHKLKGGKVEVTTPNGVKSYGSTPANAQKQVNLLRAVDHGWHPTKGNAMHTPKNRNAFAARMGAACVAFLLLMASHAFAYAPTVLQNAVTAVGTGTSLAMTGFSTVLLKVSIDGTAGQVNFGIQLGTGAFTPLKCLDTSTGNSVTNTTASGMFVCQVPGETTTATINTPLTICSSCTVTVSAQPFVSAQRTIIVPDLAPLGTPTNCSSSGGTCAAAAAGNVTIAAAATTVTVATTAVNATSQIFVMEDSTLNTKLGVTCNTTISRTYAVTTRTAGTSFVITASAAPAANPACLSYLIVN